MGDALKDLASDLCVAASGPFNDLDLLRFGCEHESLLEMNVGFGDDVSAVDDTGWSEQIVVATFAALDSDSFFDNLTRGSWADSFVDGLSDGCAGGFCTG
jgi:hypothetical protein